MCLILATTYGHTLSGTIIRLATSKEMLVDTYVSIHYNMAMLDLAMRAIAEPRRRDILRLIQNTELPSGSIAAHFDVTRPAISQHLKVLEEAGLIAVRREGTKRLYRTKPEGLAEVRQFLEEFWDMGLKRLAEAAEAEERRTKNSDT